MNRHRTPLRYPGGKQKLAPFIEEVMLENDLRGGHYAEPYAGGAGVAMELLLNGAVSRVHLNDSCKRVYAFWRSILTKPDEFCRKISRASLTVDEWKRQREVFRNPTKHAQLDVGFSAFFLNRCNRSGILSGGLIGGLLQTGQWAMDARFPRNELIKRVESIAAKRSSITVKNWDAERFLHDYVPDLPKESLVYLDPPYFHMGGRLYLNHYKPADHVRLSRTVQRQLKRLWIVTYDAVPDVLKCYAARRRLAYDLAYSAGKAYAGTEVAFFSDDLILPRESRVPWLQGPLRRARFQRRRRQKRRRVAS